MDHSREQDSFDKPNDVYLHAMQMRFELHGEKNRTGCFIIRMIISYIYSTKKKKEKETKCIIQYIQVM